MRTFVTIVACIVVVLLAVWIYLNHGQGREAMRQQDQLIQQQDALIREQQLANCLKACEFSRAQVQERCANECKTPTP